LAGLLYFLSLSIALQLIIERCHFHVKSVYRLTALLAAMVVGLDINRKPMESEKEKLRLTLAARPKTQDFSLSGADFWNTEARRAFVGSYVLCCRYTIHTP
jgi:hypothetical protein